MCGRKFTTSSQFNFHRMRHTGVRPWGCSYCHRNFLTKSSLETHVRRHFDEKPIRCPHCPMSFVDKSGMMRHRRVQHSQEHPHICVRCGKKFKDRSNFLKHTRIHDRKDKLADGNPLRETVQGDDRCIENDTKTREIPNSINTDHRNASVLRITQVVDEQGLPISIKTQDGLSIPIVTGNDGNRVHGLLPDGTLVPIELNDLEDKNIEEIVINNSEEPTLEGPISILTGDLDQQPLNTNIQTDDNEHGQEGAS
ncbi:unnamed protein product [Acanthoscelides obtectus]|uniref:C2H2-type domain-containing protein n=1 Tax=Acanthoscelides obtectus TaxID=200917 RepID=A0A9P0QG65_ACAOB|nr:unnamed protein product [Acanthoscelides obtectus]CAK1682502.1 Zinc finger protein 81 [Acanthoscelides obtectus]